MRRLSLGLAWISVGASFIGLLLPWVHVTVRKPEAVERLVHATDGLQSVEGSSRSRGHIEVTIHRGSKTITSELPSLQDLPTTISGAQIPGFIHRRDAQVVIAAVELLTGKRQQLGFKSYAVYLVPGIALCCGLLLTTAGHRTAAVHVGIMLVAAGLAGVGARKLLSLKTSSSLVTIVLGPGLWVSVGAYLGLAVAAAGMVLPNRRRIN